METIGATAHHHKGLDKPFSSRHEGLASPLDGRSAFRSGSWGERASMINTADGHHGMLEPLNAGTPRQAPQDASRGFICLCTPTPKIPRPRNAFILYRQHHQSQVTAENPKLSNPEISKIIGDKWKHETQGVKENWKKLAEEEKQRHHHQYPHYRYQPRRGSKTQGNWTSTSPTDEHGRCPKCHGRSISTPRTPSTPIPISPVGNFSIASQTQPSLKRVDSTVSSRRSSFEQSPTSNLPFSHQLSLVRDVDNSEPDSPEAKRRRANGAGGYHAIIGPSGAYTIGPSPDLGRTSPKEATSIMSHYTGTTLPDLRSLPRSRSGPMPPPFRPLGALSWMAVDKDPHNRRHSDFDQSLKLPPLQTSIPPSPSSWIDRRHVGIQTTRSNVSPTRHQCSQNLGTKIASVEPTLIQKLSTLSTISDPLPCVGYYGPCHDQRGAFIAVEGANPIVLDQVGQSLEKVLVAGGDVALKIWKNDEPSTPGTLGFSAGKDKGVVAGPREAMTGAEWSGFNDDLLSTYFDIILSWRQKSQQIAYHVTGGRVGRTSQKWHQDKDSKVVQALSTEACTPPHDDKSPEDVPRTPVALVEGGLSLTISNKYASAMPISDKYTPADHWQWMASLWRGTANPDLVVYVQESDGGSNDTIGTVDVSKRMGLIVVNVPKGNMLDEATERRMGFEVMEWMREGLFREEVPRSWRQDSL